MHKVLDLSLRIILETMSNMRPFPDLSDFDKAIAGNIRPRYGEDSLRWPVEAIAIMVVGCLHYKRGERFLTRDEITDMLREYHFVNLKKWTKPDTWFDNLENSEHPFRVKSDTLDDARIQMIVAIMDDHFEELKILYPKFEMRAFVLDKL